jgi:valyl-tRNA synthetase
MRLSLKRIAASRNFANKIWNAARFVVNSLDETAPKGSETWNLAKRTLADRWIISRHNHLVRNVTRLLESYQFGEAGRQIYDFLWGEYCDWFIEIAKIRLYGDKLLAKATAQQVLIHVLEQTLRLLHPFMPFVTEEIWHNLPRPSDAAATDALMVVPWPEGGEIDEEAEADMSLIMETIRAIRNARAEHEVEPGRRIKATVAAGSHYSTFAGQRGILARLARIDPESLSIVTTLPSKPEKAVSLVIGTVEVYLPLAGMVDLDAEQERLNKELAEVQGQIAHTEKLLANQDFISKAPPHIVDRERSKLEDLQDHAVKLGERLKGLA